MAEETNDLTVDDSIITRAEKISYAAAACASVDRATIVIAKMLERYAALDAAKASKPAMR